MLLSLILLLLAIATFRLITVFDDDVMQLAVLLGSALLLIIGLLIAPWIIQIGILMTLLLMLERLKQKTPT